MDNGQLTMRMDKRQWTMETSDPLSILHYPLSILHYPISSRFCTSHRSALVTDHSYFSSTFPISRFRLFPTTKEEHKKESERIPNFLFLTSHLAILNFPLSVLHYPLLCRFGLKCLKYSESVSFIILSATISAVTGARRMPFR